MAERTPHRGGAPALRRTEQLIQGLRAAARQIIDAGSGRVRVAFPDGHFYSPIPNLEEVRRRRTRIFAISDDLAGIDLRGADQLSLVRELAAVAEDAFYTSGTESGLRFHFENDFFSYGDGLILHAMLRHRKPQLVVEVGSGYSSALILDTADRWLPELRVVFIEPFGERLRSLLKSGDAGRAEIIEAPVQDVGITVFDRLGPGDFLIIDSTHVAKVGSDVLTLLFEVLPRLKPGVIVHLHDIFYPFEYPEEWVMEGRAWNEAYLLRAFLTGNAGYQILLWNSYLAALHRDAVLQHMPEWGRNPGGSIWLERTDASLSARR